jgi:hypothetical protein
LILFARFMVARKELDRPTTADELTAGDLNGDGSRNLPDENARLLIPATL